MSVLSNVELEANLNSSSPFVTTNGSKVSRTDIQNPIEAASIRLSVGKIFQFRKMTGGVDLVETRDQVILHQGEVAFVLTNETVVLDNLHVGLVTPKSGGVAEKGILITNTGHVDPGYSGNLRYAVINMGQEDFCLRRGDVLVKIMILRLGTKADPDWSANSIRPLGHDFLNLEARAKQIAEAASRDMVAKILREWGIPTLAMSLLLSAALGVGASLATIAASAIGTP